MNVFKGQNKFFQTPQVLVESGLLHKLSPSAVRIYTVLLFLAQKYSAVQLEVPAYQFEDYAGVSWRSIGSAREELEREGLVVCHKGRYGVIAFQLLNPETHVPLPAPEGRRGVHQYRPSGRSAETIKQSKKLPEKTNGTALAYPVSWNEIARDPAGEPGEDKYVAIV